MGSLRKVLFAPGISKRLMAILALCHATLRAQTVIDNFDQLQAPLSTASSSIVSGAMLGGERDQKLTVTSGTLTTEVKTGTYFFSQDAGATGSAEIVWDGADGTGATISTTGLGSLDLTAGSQNAFLLGILSASENVSATLTVYSSGGNTRTLNFVIPAGSTPNYMSLEYTAFSGSGDFSTVGAIQLVINSSPGASLVIDFLRTANSTLSTTLDATMTDVVLVDRDGNGKAGPGDTIKYIVTIKNNSATDKTGVAFNASAPANTTLGPVSSSPIARPDAPAGSSAPGNDFHTALNTTLNTTAAGAKLLDNDFTGSPSATVTHFGGGSLGGTVADHPAGSPVSFGATGQLTVNSDGTLVFTPDSNFTGLFSFQYRLANSSGSSDTTATIAVGVRPGAVTDSYNVTGNTSIDTTVGGLASLTANDSGDVLTVTANTLPSKGNLSRSGANFIYTPALGATGADSFTYTLHNGFGDVTGTVNLTISNEIWYIDSSVAVEGDGRSTSPFKTLAAFNTANTGASAAVPGDNDLIFIRQGTYQNDVAGGGLVLRNGQRLIGDGSSSDFSSVFGFNLAPGSVSSPGVAIASFSNVDPVIQNGTGNGIALAQNNTLRGVTAGSTPNGAGFSGSTVGNLVIAESSKISSGAAISITSSGFFSSVSFDTLESTSSTSANLALTGVTGSFTVASGGSGFAGSSAGSAAVSITGGSVSFTWPGNITKNNNAALLAVTGGHTGTLTFNGTLNASNGTGLQFDNADGTYNFNGTATLNGGDAGIDILNGSSGTFSFGSSVVITNPSGTGFNLSNSDAIVTYSGSISDNTGFAIDLNNHDAGTITFQTGPLVATSQGIRVQNCNGGTINFNNPAKNLNTLNNAAVTLTSNSGATINFGNGGLAIVTSGGTGFSATGGAAALTVTGSGNTISAGTATALNVTGTTIGASGLNFQSISSSGGSATGIILDGTGSNGGLTVTGLGSAASGGTIANKSGSDGSTGTGIGIYLNNTRNISLSRMQLNGLANFAIRGTTVVNFTLSDSIINGLNGDNANVDDAPVSFTDLTGTASIARSTIQGGIEDNFRVINSSGILNRIVFDTVTFGTMDASLGDNGLLLQAHNSATLNATIQNCSFTSARGDQMQFDLTDTAIGDLVFQNNQVNNAHPAVVTGGGGVTLSGGGSSGSNVTLTYSITGNNFTGARGDALLVLMQTGNGLASGEIRNNTFGTSGVDKSGSLEASGIDVRTVGRGAQTVAITGNTIYQYSNYGILLQMGDQSAGGSSGTVGALSATVSTNNISQPSTYAFTKNGIQVNLGTTAGDTYVACVDIHHNDASAGGSTDVGAGTDYVLRQRQSTTLRLPGYTGANNDNAAVISFIQGQNSGTETVFASNTVATGGGGFQNSPGGASCAQP